MINSVKDIKKECCWEPWADVANELEFVENGKDKPVYRHQHKFKIYFLI